jgi:mono/diheme cytochrome c family protein
MSYVKFRLHHGFAACVVLAGGWLAAQAASAATLPAPTKAFLQNHCFECHDADAQKGKVRLDNLAPDFAVPVHAETWGRVFAQLEKREMPPKKKPQPSDAERQAVLDWLGPQLRAAVAARQNAEGRVALRRLNRFEYQNTMHDLLGIEVNLMELLPEDGSAHGFDKVSSALTLSPVQVEKYLEAADVALDAAIGIGPKPQFVQQRFAATNLLANWDGKSHRPLPDGSIALFNSGYSPTELRKFRAPAPGRYRIRISANGFQTDGKPATFRVYGGNFGVGGKTKLLGHFEVPADKPTVVEMVERLDGRGDTLKVISYGTIPWQNKAEEYTGPGFAVQWIEVEGPLDAKDWPPATRQQLLGEVDLERGVFADAERVMKQFAPRAFRRPVSDADLAPYLALVRERMDKGVKFGDALRVGLKAILVSPRFLMLDEQPGKLDGHALASRLSYFLWSSAPDAELLSAAAKGDLSKPAGLRAQVERLLKHPKAHAFTEDFTGQWLALRNIEFTTPDSRLYPEFDELLQVSMLQETHAFFDELLTKDLSALNFVDSDFAMLNGRLAKHYGIPGVGGLDIRRVALKPEWHRGGVMTHASVLKVSANGTTTSPVLRGVWILDRILGKPAPPPPPNVPAVEPDIRGAKSIRDQLAKHREVESCAGCHARIDPLGFALESYDVIGGWRERYRITPAPNQRNGVEWFSISVNQRDMRLALGPKVDASDALADGRKFSDLAELKRLLLAESDALARGLAEKLLIYATGHGLEFTDEAVLTDIVRKAKAKNFGLRSLVHEVVASQTFQTK